MATAIGRPEAGGTQPPGRDQPLSRERIVDAALALIDREGARALSMRRVATEVGAGTMSLYNHVADKAELQSAVLERVLEGVEYAPEPDARVSGRRLVRDVRARFLDHPETIGLLARGAQAESLVRGFAEAYRDLTERGADGETAIRMIAAVSRYTIGALLGELYGRSSNTDRARRDADFDFGLDALFAGFAVHLGVDPSDPPARLPGTAPAPATGS